MRQFSIFLFAIAMSLVVWNDAYACGGRGSCGSYRSGGCSSGSCGSYRNGYFNGGGCSSGSCGSYRSGYSNGGLVYINGTSSGCVNGTCGVQKVIAPAKSVEFLKPKQAAMPSFSQESFE